MMNDGNKCLPPSVITLPPHRVGQKYFTGGGGEICALHVQLEIFCPPLAKTVSPPLNLGLTDIVGWKNKGFQNKVKNIEL